MHYKQLFLSVHKQHLFKHMLLFGSYLPKKIIYHWNRYFILNRKVLVPSPYIKASISYDCISKCMYLNVPLLSHLEHIHPLTYWKEKKPLWPCLAGMAHKCLSIPPFSAAPECLFATAADVVFPERNTELGFCFLKQLTSCWIVQ